VASPASLVASAAAWRLTVARGESLGGAGVLHDAWR
jgi:hypothetical protein